MAYVNTGYERAQGVLITKMVNGVLLSGYPKGYSIIAAFTANSNSYPILTTQEFQELTPANYNQRLADFKIYVQTAESIANVDAITEVGYEAYRENTTSCPIGA